MSPTTINPDQSSINPSLLEAPLIQRQHAATNSNHSTNQQMTRSQTLLGMVGFAIGALGVYAFFPLGGNFGTLVANKLLPNYPSFNDVFYYIFAFGAILPMIALAGLASRRQLLQLTQLILQRNNHSHKPMGFQLFSKVTAYTLGLFAAITPAYVTITYLPSSPTWVVVTLSLIAYFAGFSYKVEAELKLLQRFFSHKRSRDTKKLDLLTKLDTAQLIILEDKNYFTELNEIDNFENKLAFLINLGHINRHRHINVNSTYAYIVKAIALFLGSASAYVYFSLGLDAATYAETNFFNLQANYTNLNYIIAILVLIPWGCLGAEATLNRFNEFFLTPKLSQQAMQKNRPVGNNKLTTILSLILGAFATVPLTYLAIVATENFSLILRCFILATSFIGPVCIRSNAIGTLLDKMIAWKSTTSNSNPASVTKYQIKELFSAHAAFIESANEETCPSYNGA